MFEKMFELDRVPDLVAIWPRLFVHGIEVTQGVQYFKSDEHLTDTNDQGGDNAVTLVAHKPAWVRVYVRSWFPWGDIPDVTGTLEISRSHFGPLYQPVATLSPQPPGVVNATPNPDYAVERGSLINTLNFIIPADHMCGILRLRAEIESPSGPRATMTVYVNVTLQQTLNLRGIMVGYNGPSSSAPGAPNLTLAAPTLADLQTTSGTTLLTFPVRSQANYSSAGTITWTQPLTDAPSCNGCCSPNWVALNAAVDAQRVADGNQPDVLYYGLMANGIPMGPIVGCNTGTVSTSSVGAGMTMAHELGHACGLPHAPCGTGGDPNYPAYEPYDPAATPMASIGEYGLDISNGAIKSPAIFKDLMSYCGPRWISLYNYGRLTNNPDLNPVHTCIGYPWWRDVILQEDLLIPEHWLPDPPPDPDWRIRIMQPEPLISIIGVMHFEDELEVLSVMRVQATSKMHNPRATGLTAELVGEEGQVLSAAPLMRLRDHASGCGCQEGHDESGQHYPHLMQAFLKDVGPGAELRIRRGEKEVWSRQAPKEPPRISTFEASLEREQLVAVWDMETTSEHEPMFWVQWSADGGESWHALASSLRGERAGVDAGTLPGGKVELRLFGSDGFFTAVSETIAVEVPERPLAVSILTPRDGQTLVAGQPMRLWGAAQSDRPADEAELRAVWILNGEEVAEGPDTFFTAPSAGEHKLTLQVSLGDQRGEATVSFITVQIPPEQDKPGQYKAGA
jgi:hypothetical protein